jgi:hypothetical protein
VKTSLPSLTVLLVLCASCSVTAASVPLDAPPASPAARLLQPLDEGAEPPVAPARPFRGSTVLVPPLISLAATRAIGTTKVLRLPVQAGKVSKMVTTNLLANSISWIAKGNRYYSLCKPEGRHVRCAPIVATSTMKDIEINAYADDHGAPRLSFGIVPATTEQPQRLIAAINYFLARTGKQIAHFDRAVGNTAAPHKQGAPGGFSTPALLDDTGGASCDHDCSGGDAGLDGEGYELDSGAWGEDDFDGEDSWDEEGTSSLPSFPPGNDNGDADPCIDDGGNNLCQQVIIIGERPELPQEMAGQNCVFTPWAIACTRPPAPPVGIDPDEDLPRGPRPWLPQSACNFAPVFCSAGQVPASEPPPRNDAERRARALRLCYDKAVASMSYCRAMQKALREDFDFETCRQNAIDESRDCDALARG